jgi:hypothetical protein
MAVLTRIIGQGKEPKDIQIRKVKVALSLLVNDMMLYIENSKDFT